MTTGLAQANLNFLTPRRRIISSVTITVASLAASAGAATITYTTAGSQSALTIASGDTLNLRNDSSVTFTPSTITLPPSGNATLNFDVNNSGSAATNKTLTLSNSASNTALSFEDSSVNTINVTGGNGYALALGPITLPSGSGAAASHTLTINATTADVSTGTITLGSYGETLSLTGSKTQTIANLQFNSNGSNVINFGTGADTPTVYINNSSAGIGGRSTGGLAATIATGATVHLLKKDALANAGSSGSPALTIGGKLILAENSTADFSAALTATATLNGGTVVNVQNLNTFSTLTVNSGGGTLQGSYTDISGSNRRSINIGTLNGTGDLTLGDSGLGSGTAAGSIVRFTTAGGDYSGKVTVNATTAGGGSYLLLESGNALAAATVNVVGENTAATAVFSSFDKTSTLAFNGGAFKIGALSGNGSVNLNYLNAATTVALTTGNNNLDTTYSGAMAGGGSLIKIGTGTMTLTNSNTYTGATTISGGTLAVGLAGVGSLGNTAVAVNSGGTLAGSGTLGGKATVASGGTLSPGNSVGSQTIAGLALTNGGNLNWQLANATGAAGTGYDVLNLSGSNTLDLSALTGATKFNVNLWTVAAANSDVGGNAVNFNSAISQSWTLVNTNAAITNFNAAYFAVNTVASNGTSGFANAFGTGTFKVGLSADNTDLVLNYVVVPEPAMFGAVALGATGLLARRRVKQL